MGPTLVSGDQEHVLRRLEAFSDIVIALTLSSLALNLQLPSTIQDAIAHPARYIAFMGSFAIVCSIWWMHHRLFANFFVADSLGVFLNFALLGAVMMLGVALQMFFRYADALPAVVAYAACLAVLFGLFCALFARGVAAAGDTRTPEIRREGLGRARRCGMICVVMLASLAMVPLGMQVVELSWLALLPLLAVSRLFDRRLAA